MARISVTGVKEIDRVLRGLPKEISHKVQQAAHVAAAKPLVEREKLLAPEGPTGRLVDSIGAVRVPLKRADFVGEVNVGPRKRRPYRGHVGHLVEYGTKPRRLRGRGQYRKGTYRGIMPAKPFVRPAFQQTHQQVLRGIKNNLAKRLAARMKKDLGRAFIQ